MDQAQLDWLTNFIWNIADDVLRDIYVRGKYRDVILEMTVLRRLDALLEPTKQVVLDMKATLDKELITNQDDALRSASGQAFYNTSPFLLRDLKARSTQQQLKDDFEAYPDGISPNVQDILTSFEFRNQIPRLSKADALGLLIEKFLDKDIHISPYAVGELPGLDNHSMGTMFEELVRKFNEANNEEAEQHLTPRDAVKLMASLMFLPVADKIESGTYLLYDCACGTGCMLTVAEETLQRIAMDHGKQVANGSTVGHLRLDQVNALPLVWCPLAEQQAIVLHIDKESEPLNTAISRAEREITLMQEYRTRLTADILTGKLDVREAAARLPDLPTAPVAESAVNEALEEIEDESIT